MIGWDLVLEFALGAAVVARGWSGYLAQLFHLPGSLFGESSTVNVGAVAVTLLGAVATVGGRAPIASAFAAVGAGWASTLVSIAAVAGLTSVILVDIVAIGRIGFAMSRDGLQPPGVGAVHRRCGTRCRRWPACI